MKFSAKFYSAIFLLFQVKGQSSNSSNTNNDSIGDTTYSSAGPIWLTEQQMNDWNILKASMDKNVPAGFQDCKSEINDAYIQAVEEYKTGLGNEFFGALNNILTVAGDVDEYAQFRSQFQNLSSNFFSYYESTLSARAAALAAAIQTKQSDDDNEEHVKYDGKTKKQPTKPDSEGFIQAANVPHAYGVVSGAQTLQSTLAAIGFSALFFLA